MVDVYFLRHGIAMDRADHRGPDQFRPLTSAGKRRTRQVVRGIKRLGVSFDLLITSPLVRARQTAELVLEQYRRVPSQVSDSLMPEQSPADVRAALAEVQPPVRSVLLIGHEPLMSAVIGELIGGPDVSIDLKKAGLCLIELPLLEPGSRGVLRWLVPPRILTAI